jgi:predicted phage terminase large subunit-like protein
MQMVVQSWDTAVTAEPTSDFSVGMTWGFRKRKWYLLDLFRGRLEYPDLKRKIVELHRRWRSAKVIIELACSGIPLIQELQQERSRAIFQGYRPRVDKETRLAAQTAKLETGNYLIPSEADWLAEFKHELMAFPNGKYDDQVDSLAQFLDWTVTPPGRVWVHLQMTGERHRRSGKEGRKPGRRRSGRRPLSGLHYRCGWLD